MLHRELDCLYPHSKDDRIAPRYFDNRTSFGFKVTPNWGQEPYYFAVESPIDALTYRTIHACRGDAWAVVSCAGATVPNALMRADIRPPPSPS